MVQGGRLRIYQLKYFPDGLQGRGRRPSIKKSFKRAMDYNPYEWVFVVPCTLTPGERAFVMGLGEGRDVKVTVMDRTTLDDRLATHSDIERSLSRTSNDGGLLEYAKIMNRERDVLAGVRPTWVLEYGLWGAWSMTLTRTGRWTSPAKATRSSKLCGRSILGLMR